MTKNELEIVADILVEMGYAEEYQEFKGGTVSKSSENYDTWFVIYKNSYGYTDKQSTEDPIKSERVDIISNTLKSRMQLDIVEDWLYNNNRKLYERNIWNIRIKDYNSHHQWRKDRILWCISRLTKDE